MAERDGWWRLEGEQLSAMIAGNDEQAKSAVMDLAPMAHQNIMLDHRLGMGAEIGFKLVH